MFVLKLKAKRSQSHTIYVAEILFIDEYDFKINEY